MATNEQLIQIATAEKERQESYKHCITLCMAAGCMSQVKETIKNALQESVNARGLENDVEIKIVGCMGLCAAGPLVMVDNEILYEKVCADDAEDIINALGGKPVKRLHLPMDIPFFERQKKIVLENSGYIDPERIEDYIANDGYEALDIVLHEMSNNDVIDEITQSGLRGRGGAGFPTGLKWSLMAKADSETKYVVCNADEGDPGAFMNRSVLESDPHRVIEGMIIGAYAVGAQKGYIYIRAEYPLAIERLKKALQQARRNHLLGPNIMGTEFSFNIELRLGAGAFVCGEETALMASIEGKRGNPWPRPPYPADFGLWGEPTLINNVNTYSNIAPIIRNGASWYTKIGTESSKGTKVFALAGQIKNTGLIEVPIGISLREIIEDMGGGTTGDTGFKAVQTGGPSGGCIPIEHLDMPVDYDSLRDLGSIMGSGGMIVMDNTSDMVDVAKYFMEFCMDESCGKCTPCRVGTEVMYNLLDTILKGNGTMKDLAKLEQLAATVQITSLCGLGQSAPNPVLSTLRYFRHEYLEKIIDAPVAVEA